MAVRRARVARSLDALITADRATAPGAGGKPEITGDLTPVLERAKEDLVGQHAGNCQADATQPAQLDDLGSRGLGGLALFGLDLRDHLGHLPQTAALALDLARQTRRQISPVGRAQRREPLTPVSPGRLEVADALAHQEPLDAAQRLAALVAEPSPFPAATALILLRGA
jgi:hypothetical protein